MKFKKLAAAIAVIGATASVPALAALENLTTWNTFTNGYGSVSLSPNLAIMSGTAGITKSFSLGAGTAFSFDWFFDGGDYMPYNDWSQVYVDGNLNFVLANIGMVGNYGDTGGSYSTILSNAVNGAITFSVNNALDQALWSTLKVSNVDIEVPEPDALLMLATGLGVMGLIARRKQKSAAA